MVVNALVLNGYDVHELVTLNVILMVLLIYISKGPTVPTVTNASHPLASLANVQPVKFPFALVLITQSSLLKALVYILVGTVILIVSVLYIFICVGFIVNVSVLTDEMRDEVD